MEARAIAGRNSSIAKQWAVAQGARKVRSEGLERRDRVIVSLCFLGSAGNETRSIEEKASNSWQTNGKRQDGDVDGAGSQAVEKGQE